ncbi:MAG: hypothetical protein QOG68_475 [Solirubrobacteraceae bacterium]|jgi:RimJ/RimL family protein N-acetyltransferase|nr:hypothetical protein [Solirubrobacteraceae bacterium]
MPIVAATLPISLPDGRGVGIRAITAADCDRLREAFERLSPESRYRRFLAPVAELSAAMLQSLTDVDHSNHEALVAICPGSGQIVGVARFVRLADDREAAELAVTVADDWQHDGLGTVLVALLADRARACGVHRFVGEMLWRNRPMHHLLRELAIPEIHGCDGVDEFSVLLPAEPVAAGR